MQERGGGVKYGMADKKSRDEVFNLLQIKRLKGGVFCALFVIN